MRALHAQINPHFFFNSLNTIRYFIRTDPDNARDLLTKLAEIFQRTLSAGEFVTLAEEIRHVEAYLSLEKARLEERLQVVWTHLAKQHQEQQIPTLILQPLVENAVIHGISPKPEGGTIHIIINSIGSTLLIQVDDDGMGFDMEAKPIDAAKNSKSTESNAQPTNQEAYLPAGSGTSIGLTNIRQRLQKVYGEDASLHLESKPSEGTKAVLTIPLIDTAH
ncbi:MAG: histidine kinase [Chloroflexota bacterium]